MSHDHVLNELLKIVNQAVAPIAADKLVRGTIELALKPPLLQVLIYIFNIQSDGSTSHINSFDDVILTVTQRVKLDRFLYIINRIPTVRLRQRSVESFENSIDLGVFHNLKFLILEHINLRKLKFTSHLKSQLVSFSCSFCSEIEAVFADKLSWAELVDLSLQYCKLEPSNNAHYFRNAPWLTILNLSYCKLKSCEFLVGIHHLEHLKLSFNFLPKVPTFSDSCDLKTLKMDNNCVQELSGIERIPSLKYFDLSHNWLPNKYSLMPLENAESLVTIKLAGCPVSFVKYYRIYVAMCICTKTPPSQVEIDGVPLSKTEQSVLGLNLLKKETDSEQQPPASLVDPSTSTNIFQQPPELSHTPGKSKPRVKKSLVRVPVIHDDSSASLKEAESPSSVVELDDDVPRAPTVVPKGPVASVSFTLTEELRAIQEAILRSSASQASRTPQENGMQTTLIKPDPSELHLGGITIPSFLSFDDDSPIPEIVPEKVFALVHATESENLENDSNRLLEPNEKSGDDMENDGSIVNTKVGRSRVTFMVQDVCEKDLHVMSEELSERLEEELFTTLGERDSQATYDSDNVKLELNSNNPPPSCSETTLDEQITVGQYESKTWDHNSDSGAGSDMKTSAESMVAKDNLELEEKRESDNQPCTEIEVSDEEFCSPNSEKPGETRSPAGEVAGVGDVIIDEKLSENGNGTPKDSDEESCYESDPDADEFLWHVMRVDPTTKVDQPIFLALLENELKERSPKSGETLTKWPLEMVLSCVKTKNIPITIEMEFDTVKKDKQHREYVMEYADAQALTKKIYNILESRPLSAMNQVSHSCLKCSTIFVCNRPSVFGAKESVPSCPVCGSMTVVETEEPKMPEKNAPAPKPLSHSPSQSSIVIGHGAETPGSSEASSTSKDSRICSARSMEQGLRPEALMNPRKYESDIEVISNPSQSSIEVIDESSRSQSVTPMRKKSEERQTALTTEQNIREVLSPLSALTESSSSGSLTESVITAYESSSVIINKKSVECLPEANCENSPSENSMSFATKVTTEEENDNVAGPKCVRDVYSFTDFLDVELRVKTFIYHSIFQSENEELRALVRCHIWKTGGSDYDGCFVLSNSDAYFLYHKMTDFSDQICDWLSLSESFQIADLKRVQPIIWYQGLEIQVKNFSFILLLMDGDRTQNLTKHFNSLSLKGVKIVAKPNPKVELSLQQAVFSNDLNHNSEDPSVIYMVLCRSLEITKVEVEEEEILRLAGLVLTCGLFIVIPGDLSWLCSGAQPAIVASRDLSSLIEVEKKGKQLVFHFLDEAEAVEEIWSLKFGVDSQLGPLLDAIRRPWERRFSVPLEITGL